MYDKPIIYYPLSALMLPDPAVLFTPPRRAGAVPHLWRRSQWAWTSVRGAPIPDGLARLPERREFGAAAERLCWATTSSTACFTELPSAPIARTGRDGVRYWSAIRAHGVANFDADGNVSAWRKPVNPRSTTRHRPFFESAP